MFIKNSNIFPDDLHMLIAQKISLYYGFTDKNISRFYGMNKEDIRELMTLENLSFSKKEKKKMNI